MRKTRKFVHVKVFVALSISSNERKHIGVVQSFLFSARQDVIHFHSLIILTYYRYFYTSGIGLCKVFSGHDNCLT